MRRALILALLLPACVPVTLPEAEEQCARNAASGGGGSVAVGASTGNAAIGVGGGTVGIGVGTGNFYGTGAGPRNERVRGAHGPARDARR